MIRIAIYEGDRSKAEKKALEIKGIMNELKLSYELHIILQPEQLMILLHKNPFEYDFICLSLECIDITEKIISYVRKYNQRAELILFDGTADRLHKLLKYKPSGWFSGDEILSGSLYQIMKYDCEIIQKSKNQFFYIKTKTQITKIPYSDITYFESNGRQAILHGMNSNNVYAFMAKLDDVLITLPKDIFCRCHQSMLVNLLNVKSLDKSMKQFKLNNGMEVDISKGHYKEVVDSFEKFMNQH